MRYALLLILLSGCSHGWTKTSGPVYTEVVNLLTEHKSELESRGLEVETGDGWITIWKEPPDRHTTMTLYADGMRVAPPPNTEPLELDELPAPMLDINLDSEPWLLEE